MAEVATLRKGNMYEEDGHLWKVIDFQHIKVARGGATIRLKVRNVRTGSTVEKTYNNGTRLTDVRLEGKEMQYLYHDGDLYFFMDTETYEQIILNKETLEDAIDFMTDNQIIEVDFYETEPITVTLPTTVDLVVEWAEFAVAGDTANNPSKKVRVVTGFQLDAPMFVKEGDTIRIDTRDGRYVTRV